MTFGLTSFLLAGAGVALLACSQSSQEEGAPEASEADLGLASPASVNVCQGVVRSLGDPAASPFVPMPMFESCRPGQTIPMMPFVSKELAVLWGTRPSQVCTWLPNDRTTFCGGATPASNAAYCATDDTIAYDVTWLDGIAQRHGQFAVATIVAHEWGHLNQARVGLLPAAPPFRYSIQNELQADCQAGVYVGLEQLLNRGLTDSHVLNAFATFCELSDQAGTPWFDPTAHGSCTQRTDAFGRGYQAALAGGDQLCAPTGRDAFGRPTGLAAMLAFCAF